VPFLVGQIVSIRAIVELGFAKKRSILFRFRATKKRSQLLKVVKEHSAFFTSRSILTEEDSRREFVKGVTHIGGELEHQGLSRLFIVGIPAMRLSPECHDAGSADCFPALRRMEQQLVQARQPSCSLGLARMVSRFEERKEDLREEWIPNGELVPVAGSLTKKLVCPLVPESWIEF
jgi:hypothetical protein